MKTHLTIKRGKKEEAVIELARSIAFLLEQNCENSGNNWFDEFFRDFLEYK